MGTGVRCLLATSFVAASAARIDRERLID